VKASRVLIVEDDERLAELTRDFLEKNGLVVSLETNGSHAVDRIRNELPDLVVPRPHAARRGTVSPSADGCVRTTTARF